MTRKICSILLIAVTTAESLAMLFVPSVSQASIGSAAGSFTSCYVSSVAPAIENGLGQAAQAAILSPKVQSKINNVIGSHLNDFKSIFSGKIGGVGGTIGSIAGGFLSGIASFIPFGGILGGLLGLGGPQQVVDQNSEKILTSIYDYLANTQVRDKIIARCTAKTVEDQIIGNTLDIARTMGRDGGPAFVTNWNNFETQSQYRGENIFRAELSTAQLCNYFGNDVKQSYGVDPSKKINIPSTVDSRTESLQPFSLQSHCTLPNNFNLNNYEQNFGANGGWNTYDQMLQPQNNPYGVGFLSQDEVQSQRDLQQTADNTQAIANGGTLGVSGKGKGDSCLVQGLNGDCLYYKDIKTPGSYLGGAVNAATGAEFGWINNTQDLGGLVANATGVMINRLLDFSNPNEGNYTDPNDASIPDTPYTGPTDAQSLYQGTASSSFSNGQGTVSSHNYTQDQWKQIILSAAQGIDPSSSTALQAVVNTLKGQGYSASIIMNNGKPSDHKVWLEGAAWTFISSDNYQPGTFRWDPYIQVQAITPYNSCGIPLSDPGASACTTSSTSSGSGTSGSGSSGTSTSTSTSGGGSQF